MKKLNKIDMYVAFVFTFAILFIIAMTIVFCIKGSIPDSLVDLVKYLCSTECVGLVAIKYIKTRKDENNGVI